MLKVAVTKGKVERDFNKLLKKSEFNIDEIENKDRKLLIKTKDDLEMCFLKPVDVIKFVDRGIVDIGIVGKDTMDELDSLNYKELLDLDIGKCYFALAGYPEFKNKKIKVVATKYPKIAIKYFEERNEKVKIIKMEGSVELGAVIGMADAIVDIVETGSTLKANGLVVLDKICDVSTRLITNNKSFENKNNEIINVVNKLKI